jgi:polyhydroxybutyrate depolymerase
MIRKLVILLIIFSAFLFTEIVFAQETLREKIRERIKSHIQGQTEKVYGLNDPEFTLMHEGIARKYKVHFPPQYDAKAPFPVVIYIHGGGGSMRAAYMDGLDKAADKFSFILAVPQGTGEVKLGHLRGSWNGGKWATGECRGSADDIGFISKMIDELKLKFKVDARRIYATGISNGGLMTNRIGCELSDKIAAIATVAPEAVESNCNPSRPMPVMDIHGTADPANPPDGSEPRGIFAKDSSTGFAMSYKRMTPYQVVDAWKKINKCSDKHVPGYQKGAAKCVIYNDCADSCEVELCMVEGMGHAYPSGAQYFTAKVVGPVSYDISFEQIWEFFKKHPKP